MLNGFIAAGVDFWLFLLSNLKEVGLVGVGLVLAKAYRWYNSTRHVDQATGARAKHDIVEAEIKSLKLLQETLDNQVQRQTDIELRLDLLEDQNAGFRSYVRGVKEDAPEIHQKHKHKLR